MVAAGFEAAGEAAVNPDIDGDGVGVPKRDPPAAVLGAAAAVVGRAGGVGKRAGLLIADSGFWGGDSIEKNFGSSFVLKNHLSFGSRFPTLRKCFKNG